jgi:NAD(P)-dependent dehydrogenase (short-subunit alcohol dehydrogenase family)
MTMAIIETQDLRKPVYGDDLTGRVAMVTGGTRGIGAAICRSLAEHGATVAAGFSRDNQRAEEFRRELEDTGATVSLHQGNVGSGEDARRTIREAIDQHGQLDILVNNAGITVDRTIGAMTDDDWLKVIDVNLSGAFFMSKPALEHMLERGSGRIVNISSIIGQTGNIDPDGVGVTVNAVAPGFIETEMLDSVPPKVLDRIRSAIPFDRLGRPEEVARVVCFLAADASAYITGQVWAVNGGQEM